MLDTHLCPLSCVRPDNAVDLEAPFSWVLQLLGLLHSLCLLLCRAPLKGGLDEDISNSLGHVTFLLYLELRILTHEPESAFD